MPSHSVAFNSEAFLSGAARGMRKWGLPMAESSTISPRLAQEFFETLREYIQQAFSAPDSGMTFDRYVRMSLVCGRVESFVDPLPDDAFDALYHLAMDDEMHKHLKEALGGDPTYATAARCLRELIEEKKRKYVENEERRGNE